MQFIENYEREFRFFLYGDKAKKLDISKYVFVGRSADSGIKLGKIIRNCSTKDNFRKKVISLLKSNVNTDYLHFSLIMGLYFGCFNLYNYLYIVPKVRNNIILTKPSRGKTLNFLINNYSSIFNYFNKKYGIDDNTLRRIISKMFFIVDTEDDYISIYNNYVCRDLGIILMGTSLFGEFVSCEYAIDYFYEENDNLKLKKK